MQTTRRMQEVMERSALGLGVAAMMGLVGAVGSARAQSWVPAGGGTWNDINNWSTLSLPDSDTAQVDFTKNYTAAPVVTLGRATPFTVNKITHKDTVTAYYSLTINPGSPAGSIIFSGTTPTVDTPAAAANATDLTITAPVDLSAAGLTKTGARNVYLNGVVTGFGPLVYNNVNAGMLAIGAATPIDWTTINKATGGGTLRLDALTTMTVPATFSVGAGTLQLNPASGMFGFDASGFTKSGNGALDFVATASGPGGSAALQVDAGKLAFRQNLGGFASGTVASGAGIQIIATTSPLAVDVPLTLNGNGSAYSLEFPNGNTKTYNINSNIVLNGDVIIRAYGLINTYAFKGAVTGSGENSLSIRSEGANTANQDHIFNLAAASTYTGTTTLNAITQAGVLKLGVDDALPSTTTLTLIGGGNANTHAYLEMNGKKQTLAGLTATPNTGGAVVKNSGAAATLTLNTSSDFTMAGQLAGNIALNKTGSATFALTGENTYTGVTTINEGTLQVGDGGTTGALGSGVVSNNATLVFNRSDTVTLTDNLEGSGTLVVSAGTLKLSPMPVPVDIIVNAGFELPAYTGTEWHYLTSDGETGGWTFSVERGGIARNGSPWLTPTLAPEGVQAAFLQKASYVKQDVTLPATAAYRLSFSATKRPTKDAGDLALVVDGVTNATWTAAQIDNGGVFKSYSVDLGELSAGTHEFMFEGSVSDTLDRATLIDAVQISRISGMRPGPIATSAQVSIIGGATLELDGANQSLAALSGGGLVTNSAATTATLTIGGDSDSTFGGVIGGDIALAKTGTGTWELGGSSAYSGATEIQGGTLQLSPALGSVTVDNASFETHDTLANGTWGKEPTGATWVFSASAGISTTNNVWIATGTTLDGTKAGFVQRLGTISGTISVTDIGWYTISFLAGKRPGFPATQLFVEVDGATQFQFAPAVFVDAGAAFSGTAYLSSGAHTLKFRGYSTADAATWIDQVAITSMGGSLPAGTPASLSADATLDLGGNTQALAGLSGSGLVTNGTLTVSGTIAPGGANQIGTLTLATTTTLTGTLLIDVATDGSCDLLQVQGTLDLSNLDMQIQDLAQLGTGKQYVIARCTPGGLTGHFLSDNLGGLKSVRCDNAAGEVRLIGRGTVICFQ